jgi:hypothetical protein
MSADERKEARGVRVRVGDLVLEGFAPSDRFAIAEGLKRELTRLIAHRGIEGTGRKTAAVDGGAFALEAGANAGSIGRHVAQSVHRRLAGGRAKK